MFTGAIQDKKDNRDYIFEALGFSPLSDEEWKKGYDIEKEIGYKLPVKDQMSSFSCVGQAFAHYMGVLLKIKNKKFREVSAKSIYALIALGNNQGAYLRDGASTTKEIGVMWEDLLNSYRENGATDEKYMTDKTWFNNEAKQLMKFLRSTDYYLISNHTIDGFARAILSGNGMVAGVNGNNNGTWTSIEPQPPNLSIPQNQIWRHALFFGKFGVDAKGKYIEAFNSWGNIGNGGWQKLRENWFKDNGRWVFNPWNIIIKNNNMNESVKVLKDKNSSAVGVWFPAISEAVLKSYLLNVNKELPMKNREIDWEKLIDGEFEYK